MKIIKKLKDKLPLLAYLIDSCSSGENADTVHLKILETVKNINDFDEQIESFTFEVIDFGSNNLKDLNVNQGKFIQLNKFIWEQRKKLLKKFRIKEKSNYIKKKQGYVGFIEFTPKPPLIENKDEYKLIFG